MNNITIAGHIGRDAELRRMPNGDPVASFSVADSYGKDKTTIWWNCSLFGKRAEALAPYLLKGGSVTVAGTIIEREWKDKDWSPRKSMDVRVNEISLHGGRREEQTPRPSHDAAKALPKGSGFDDMDDDIPF